VNLIHGAEQTDNSRDKRTLADLVATIKPAKPFTIILNYDNGKEEKVIAGADAKWSGVSGIVKYDISDTYSLAVRAEYFDDADGYRTGTVQKMKEVTVTPEIRLDGGLIVRPEYRHDISDKQSFKDGTKKSQDTIALGVMYAW
jgi:maltoporin